MFYVFYMIFQFRLNGLEKFIATLYGFEKQWPGIFDWKTIVSTTKVYFFKGERLKF